MKKLLKSWCSFKNGQVIFNEEPFLVADIGILKIVRICLSISKTFLVKLSQQAQQNI